MGVNGLVPLRRLGVFGGAFDPPHAVHAELARSAIDTLGLDRLLIVPTGDAWHKSRPLSPAADRLAMCRLAFESLPQVVVDDRELRRDGPTYTIDTLRDLSAAMPDADLYFITGADALANIFTWRDVDELFGLARFVGCTRPGYEMDAETLAQIPGERVTLVEIPALAISSTDCRLRSMRGEPVWYLVPDGVVQYIAKHDLYPAREGLRKREHL